jgi:ABC-2 type transport system permease protein
MSELQLSKSWDVTSKDFKVFLRKKNVIFVIIAIPIGISALLSFVIEFIMQRVGEIGPRLIELSALLPSFTFYFAIIAAIIPTTIASYSLVGEKIEKSLEPLLATPMTDEEILLGKGIAAFLPPIGAVYLGALIFMVSSDLLTHSTFGYYYFPNFDSGITLLILTPLSAIMSIEVNVMISSRVSDVRVSQQIGFLTVFPMAGIYLASELSLITLDAGNLLIISGIFLIVDILFLYLTKAIFRREEILTKWK